MDKQENCLGEMMEPEVIVKVVHRNNGFDINTTVGAQVLSDSFLKAAISVRLLPITASGLIDAAVNIYSNGSYTPEAHLRLTRKDIKDFVTLGPMEHTFLYLDVGRWGGDPKDKGQRTFGLVWKQYVALCEYDKLGVTNPNENPPQIKKDGKPLEDNGINEFLRKVSLKGARIKLVRHDCSATQISKYNENFYKSSPVVLDDKSVYVIIGDLHLPIVRKNITEQEIEQLDKNEQGDGLEGMGRLGPDVNLDDAKLSLNDLKKPKYTVRSTNKYGHHRLSGILGITNVSGWRKRYIGNDIFSCNGSPSGNDLAEKDLVDFITVLNSVDLPGKSVHLVQVGDMYDLWIGLGRFFKENNERVDREREPIVIPEGCTISYNGNDDNVVSCEMFIDYWVKNINENFKGIKTAFEQLPGSKTFIYGNHDNYLSLRNGYPDPQRAGITQRVKNIRKNGLFIEHGHRGDDSNRDGAISGHKLTQAVYYFKKIRDVDPNRRGPFITVPALSFIKDPNFCVYVMGHTHSPYLTKVKIDLTGA